MDLLSIQEMLDELRELVREVGPETPIWEAQVILSSSIRYAIRCANNILQISQKVRDPLEYRMIYPKGVRFSRFFIEPYTIQQEIFHEYVALLKMMQVSINSIWEGTSVNRRCHMSWWHWVTCDLDRFLADYDTAITEYEGLSIFALAKSATMVHIETRIFHSRKCGISHPCPILKIDDNGYIPKGFLLASNIPRRSFEFVC